jgi:phosphoribosyl-AMP cyclohydrolase / phosphoribosyl-ATP pyrophosphohydrolase
MKIDFSKYADGLAPLIAQDNNTGKVLMLGFVNKAAIDQTMATGRLVFFSRSKQRLWMKGETSGHYLELVSMLLDCDADSLLAKVIPAGPACHKGWDTCFNEKNEPPFLQKLEGIIAERKVNMQSVSYTASLFKKGINAIAQKVGEEAVELIIEAKDDDTGRFKNEAADLLFHYLVLLQAKNCSLKDVIDVLEERNL